MTGEMVDVTPLVGRNYEDAEGRVLTVVEVKPGDSLGREVRGVVCHPAHCGRYHFRAPSGVPERVHGHHPDYVTDLKTWQAIWRDKAPPTPRSKMTHG